VPAAIARDASAVAAAAAPVLRFEPQPGRPSAPPRFAARGADAAATIAPDGALLRSGAAGPHIGLRVVGADPAARLLADGPPAGYCNHLIGADPARWRTRVETYARVRSAGVYPGVDLVWYGSDGLLEYDFVVAPGADPRRVRVAFDGVERARLQPSGDLLLTAGSEVLCQRRPVAYQVNGGLRSPVAVTYAVGPDGIGFDLGAYDPSLPVVIDPVLEFSREEGGGGYDWGTDVAVDGGGFIYVLGNTLSDDFPTVSPFQPGIGGGLYYEQDAVILKYDPTGTQLLYSTYLGGSALDNGSAIAIDGAGNILIAGYSQSADFPVHNAIQPALAPPPNLYTRSTDVVIAKLDPSGSSLIYSTYLGGSGLDYGRDIKVDAAGNAYVTGSTKSGRPDPDNDEPPTTPFPTTPGAFMTQLPPSEAPGGFALKLGPAGTALVYSTYVNEPGAGLDVDEGGNAYVASDDGTFVRARIRKLNPAGSGLVYERAVDGHPAAIAVDGSGNAYVTGHTPASTAPSKAEDVGAYPREEHNVFVVKVNADGLGLGYSLLFGSAPGIDDGTGIAVDAAGNAVVVGNAVSQSFPVVDPLPGSPAHGAFVMKLTPAGSTIYSTFLGVNDVTENHAVALRQGDAYVVGQSHELNSYDVEVFVAKIDDEGGGPDTVGVATADAAWFLRNTNTPGPADLVFGYGPAGSGWKPLTGDWDGDGDDTPGLYDPSSGTLFLKNSNAPGPGDVVFAYGPGGAGWVPIVGDWNGDGADSLGLYDPLNGTFFLKSANTSGPADVVFAYGPPAAGWLPIAGDWNGDGKDSVGLYDPAASAFFLRNSNTAGPADRQFAYGPAGAGWTPVAGDWDYDGVTTVGLVDRPTGTWFLRDSNTAGPANLAFTYGPPGAAPLAGRWSEP